MIPLFVDCAGKRIIIFGGGEVASRKAAFFSGEAEVLVVSRSFSQKMSGLPVERRTVDTSKVTDEVLTGIMDGAFLVIGAFSDTAQNNRIKDLCMERRILFNSADGEFGDVILPAVTQKKNYTVAISTQGNSPAVSRFLREYLETHLPSLDEMVALQRDLRACLKEYEPSVTERNVILREVLHDPVIWEKLAHEPARAWKYVQERYLHE
jgi:precorrin-2 dehydrogenase/sirohydrochlorin ferrochelatase